MGEYSLRSLELLELIQGSPGLRTGWGHLVLRLLGTQTLLEAAVELRMEWAHLGLDLAEGERGKEEVGPSGRKFLGLSEGSWLGGDQSWEC